MSDNDSNEGSQERVHNRQLPGDFPLRITGARSLTTDRLAQFDEEIHASLGELLSLTQNIMQRTGPARQRNRTARAQAPEAAAGEPEPSNTTKKPKKAVTTLVSALPETIYRDQEDKSTPSLAYLALQRRILKYLSTQAADALTVNRASTWTQDIEPKSKYPKAQDALRLCYYMRSQGFDTYSKLRDGFILLFIADQKSNVRNILIDHLYWKQNITTNYIMETAETLAVTDTLGNRRAIAPIVMAAPLDDAPTTESVAQVAAILRGGFAIESTPTSADIASAMRTIERNFNVRAGEVEGVHTEHGSDDAEQPTEEQRTPGQQQDILQVRMAEAQASLNELLSGAEQDFAYVSI